MASGVLFLNISSQTLLFNYPFVIPRGNVCFAIVSEGSPCYANVVVVILRADYAFFNGKRESYSFDTLRMWYLDTGVTRDLWYGSFSQPAEYN